MMTLHWKRFTNFLDLREEFRLKPCIYLQTDPQEKILRIGQCLDIYKRYKGGTAYALEAARHGSGKGYAPLFPVKYDHEGEVAKGLQLHGSA